MPQQYFWVQTYPRFILCNSSTSHNHAFWMSIKKESRGTFFEHTLEHTHFYQSLYPSIFNGSSHRKSRVRVPCLITPRFQSMLCSEFGAAEPLFKASWPLFRAGHGCLRSSQWPTITCMLRSNDRLQIYHAYSWIQSRCESNYAHIAQQLTQRKHRCPVAWSSLPYGTKYRRS